MTQIMPGVKRLGVKKDDTSPEKVNRRSLAPFVVSFSTELGGPILESETNNQDKTHHTGAKAARNVCPSLTRTGLRA